MEVYKDIEGYEGLYQISDQGNLKSLNYHRSGKDKTLKPAKNQKGYLYVCLCKEGKHKIHKIHRLVAQTFIPNPNNYLEVNHKDENPANDCVNNLEWCDRKYNCNYGTRNQRSALSRSKQVMCVETGVVYPSLSEAARQLGFAKSNIVNVCNGRLKQAYGFNWKYV